MHLYELNGFFYIKDPIDDYDWLTETDSNPYFMLNNITRQKFIQDILPLIKSRQCTYQTEALYKIKNFIQAPVRVVTDQFKPIVEPDPINKPLKPHQLEAVKRMLMYPKYGFFLGTGTGKTLIAISFIMTLNLKHALVITPKKVVDQYKAELDKYIPNNNHIVTNYEQANKYLSDTFDAIILDESHKVKNKSSQINETLKQLTSRTHNVYLFTGTPQDKKRHEIFAQLYLLYDHFMPGKTRFTNRYFNLDDYYKPKSEKPSFSEELTEMIHSISWGKETEEVIDLSSCPEVEHIIECAHPDPMYDIIKKDRFYELPNGSVVVADSPAKLKIKLREICSGFVKVEKDGKTGVQGLTNVKNPDLSTLLPTLDKAIIYTEFKRDIKNVSKVCDSLNVSYVAVDGSTRNSGPLIDDFKQDKVRFLIMQSKSGGAGLDLFCTNNVIFYTLPESYIVFKQCKGRIRRPGQTKECNYYYFMCKDSLEKDILRSLKRKKSYTTRIFKIYN